MMRGVPRAAAILAGRALARDGGDRAGMGPVAFRRYALRLDRCSPYTRPWGTMCQ